MPEAVTWCLSQARDDRRSWHNRDILTKTSLLASVAATVVLVSAALFPASAQAADAGLPVSMDDPGSATTQLITVRAKEWKDRTGVIDWWQKKSDGKWTHVGSAKARFGSKGLVRGKNRRQYTHTTPSGIYKIPLAFGTVAGTNVKVRFRPITSKSYWCQDNKSARYNRWVERRPMKNCRASHAEHLADYAKQYKRALVIGYNWKQTPKRGAGIFLHVNGKAYTAGCISTNGTTMKKLLRWIDGEQSPRIAIGLFDRHIKAY
ncbi:L,D-transpeptidase family protein [soil metagenome]